MHVDSRQRRHGLDPCQMTAAARQGDQGAFGVVRCRPCLCDSRRPGSSDGAAGEQQVSAALRVVDVQEQRCRPAGHCGGVFRGRICRASRRHAAEREDRWYGLAAPLGWSSQQSGCKRIQQQRRLPSRSLCTPWVRVKIIYTP